MHFRPLTLNLMLALHILWSCSPSVTSASQPTHNELNEIETIRAHIYQLPKDQQKQIIRQMAVNFIQSFEKLKNKKETSSSYREFAQPTNSVQEEFEQASKLLELFNLTNRSNPSFSMFDYPSLHFDPVLMYRGFFDFLFSTGVPIGSLIALIGSLKFSSHDLASPTISASVLLVSLATLITRRHLHSNNIYGSFERGSVHTSIGYQKNVLLYRANDPVWNLFFSELRKHFGKEMPRTKKARYIWLLEKIIEVKNKSEEHIRVTEVTHEFQRIGTCESSLLRAEQEAMAEEEAMVFKNLKANP